MRSCTMLANAIFCASDNACASSVKFNWKRRERSRRVTFPRPVLAHTPTALVDHAD